DRAASVCFQGTSHPIPVFCSRLSLLRFLSFIIAHKALKIKGFFRNGQNIQKGKNNFGYSAILRQT
ncbi:MAG: hypothetical protein J6R46_06085, partial [Clostridia bacterium]|nr:hypothetical protein [Clostridia bacterium]